MKAGTKPTEREAGEWQADQDPRDPPTPAIPDRAGRGRRPHHGHRPGGRRRKGSGCIGTAGSRLSYTIRRIVQPVAWASSPIYLSVSALLWGWGLPGSRTSQSVPLLRRTPCACSGQPPHCTPPARDALPFRCLALDCNGERCGDHDTDFGAFVQAYRSARDKQESRNKMYQEARPLFLIEDSRKEIARSDEYPGAEYCLPIFMISRKNSKQCAQNSMMW
jgi:hypothetical protein